MNHSNRWLVSGVLFAAVLLAGCGTSATRSGSGNANNATAGSASSSAGGGGAASAAATDGLMKAMSGLLTARSFRARMDLSFQDRETAHTVEYIAPDRFHMISETDEMIIVGGSAWSRQTNGAWQKLPIDTSK